MFHNRFVRRTPKKIKEDVKDIFLLNSFLWELRDSNPRPSACKADALNQLS